MKRNRATTRLIETDLRRLIRGLLREADLSGKSSALVGELVEINRALEAAGVDVEIGVTTYEDSSDEQRFEFAARNRTRKGEILSYDQSDLWHPGPEDPISVIYQLHGGPKGGDTAPLSSSEGQRALHLVPWGSIVIASPAMAGMVNGPCGGAWVVQQTYPTRNGWGPLLYDLAMEFTGEAGLAPDRRAVSPDAQGVWDKYDGARGDVTPVQLDILHPERYDAQQLTPDDPSDDCVQKQALKMAQAFEIGWSDSPLSRAYRKPDGAATSALRAAGLFWED